MLFLKREPSWNISFVNFNDNPINLHFLSGDFSILARSPSQYCKGRLNKMISEASRRSLPTQTHRFLRFYISAHPQPDGSLNKTLCCREEQPGVLLPELVVYHWFCAAHAQTDSCLTASRTQAARNDSGIEWQVAGTQLGARALPN